LASKQKEGEIQNLPASIREGGNSKTSLLAQEGSTRKIQKSSLP